MVQSTQPPAPTCKRFQGGKRRLAAAIALIGIVAVPLTVTRADASAAPKTSNAAPKTGRVVTQSACITTGKPHLSIHHTLFGLLPYPVLSGGSPAKECIHVTRNGHYVYDVQASYQWAVSPAKRCGHQVLVFHSGASQGDTVLRVGPSTCIRGTNFSTTTTFTLHHTLPAFGAVCSYFTGDSNRNQRPCVPNS